MTVHLTCSKPHRACIRLPACCTCSVSHRFHGTARAPWPMASLTITALRCSLSGLLCWYQQRVPRCLASCEGLGIGSCSLLHTRNDRQAVLSLAFCLPWAWSPLSLLSSASSSFPRVYLVHSSQTCQSIVQLCLMCSAVSSTGTDPTINQAPVPASQLDLRKEPISVVFMCMSICKHGTVMTHVCRSGCLCCHPITDTVVYVWAQLTTLANRIAGEGLGYRDGGIDQASAGKF